MAPVKAIEKRLVTEKIQLQNTINELFEANTTPAAKAELWNSITELSADLKDQWSELSMELKREVIRVFVRRVEVLKSGRLKIFFAYPGGGNLPPLKPKENKDEQANPESSKAGMSARLTTYFYIQKSSIKTVLDFACFTHTTDKARK